MKRIKVTSGIGMVCAVLVLAPIGAKADTPSMKPGTKETPKGLTMAGKKVVELHATGSVTKVDGANVEVKLHNKESCSFMTNADTRVMQHGKAAAMGDIKAGDRIRVLYESKEGAMCAKEIHILPAKSAGAGTHRQGGEMTPKTDIK